MSENQLGDHLFAIPVQLIKAGGGHICQTIAYLRARDVQDAEARLSLFSQPMKDRTRIEVCGKISKMNAEHWDIFVEATWPQFKQSLPSQAELTSLAGYGRVYLVPEFDECLIGSANPLHSR